MQLLQEKLRLDERHAVLTPMSLCAACSKRVAQQPALVTADLNVMHQACYQKQQA